MVTRGMFVRIGPYQKTGLLGVALFATGAALAIVPPQLSPPFVVPLVLTWGLTAVGAVLFWIGVIGGIAEALQGHGPPDDASAWERPRSR